MVLLEYGGNVYDAVFIAVKAALHNVRMPKVSHDLEFFFFHCDLLLCVRVGFCHVQ